MKVALVYSQTDQSLAVVKQLEKMCECERFTRDDIHPDVVISIGGDGTLLSAVHQYINQVDHVRFAGVHTGHLGFYTDWRDFEVEQLIESLRLDHGEKVSYPLLEVETLSHEGEKKTLFALNEATIRKVNGTMICEVFIDQQHFETFRGDGLCVATPSGSTGVNKSLGGAVVHPSSDMMQLTEMASINNLVYRTLSSPMIFSSKEELTLRLRSDSGMSFSVDHLSYDANHLSSLNLKISSKRVSFVSYRHTPFWRRVANAFIGE